MCKYKPPPANVINAFSSLVIRNGGGSMNDKDSMQNFEANLLLVKDASCVIRSLVSQRLVKINPS